MEKQKRSAPQSTFWPALLIGIGLVWLTANLGIISAASISALFRLWPLILIAIGVDMLVGQKRPQLRPVLGLAMLALFILIAVFGPALGLAQDTEVSTYSLQVPVAAAEQADVFIDGASARMQVAGLSGVDALLNASITDVSGVELQVEGDGSNRTLRLQRQDSGFNIGFLNFGSAQDRRWDIGLATGIPLSLEFDLASGSADLDLSLLRISDLRIEGGSGSLTLRLPSESSDLSFRSDQNSGAWTVGLAAEANLNWILEDIGSGSLSVQVPDSLGVRLEVRDDGSGGLTLPGDWQQISGDDDEGVWESPDFESKDFRANITIEDRGSGSIRFES